MILIDAIDLRKKMEWICENACPNKGNKDKETLCAACPLMGAFADLDHAEEIDAIPIEWIKEYIYDRLFKIMEKWQREEYGK